MTNKERYAALCTVESSISAFNQPWWMDAVCGKDNWDVLLYEKNGEIVGALPYYIKKKYGLKYIAQPIFTQHNGIWIKYPQNQKNEKKIAYEKEIMSSLIEQLSALPICYYQQSHSTKLTNWMPFYWAGFRQSTNYTYRIPCRGNSMKEISKGFASVIRYDAKRASEQVTIEESDDIDALYTLIEKTFARQGQSARCSLEFLKELDLQCQQHNARKIYLAKNQDGVNICGIFLLCDAETVYYLLSGTDSAYRKVNALSLLLRTAIEFAVETNRDFDFEGSMVESIEDYFRKFGGVQSPYFSLQKVFTKNPIVKVAIARKMK